MARHRLIERREQLDLTQADVARSLRCSDRTVARYESGASTPRNGRRPRYAAVLHWTNVELARALTDNSPVVLDQFASGWLGTYAKIEQAATRVQVWEPVVIPGLCQTRAYATAVEQASFSPLSDEQVAQRVERRLARQGVLHRDPEPLRLEVVIDESVLRRVTGGPDVMADQLEHLTVLAELPTIDIRVLPLDGRAHCAAFGAFSLMTDPGHTGPSTACTEDLAGVRYHESPHTVDIHFALYRHLRDAALPVDQSLDLIKMFRRSQTP